MGLTITWGPQAIAAGFGRVQDLQDLFDAAFVGTTLTRSSETTAEFSFLFNGQSWQVEFSGSGFLFRDATELLSGNITEITIRNPSFSDPIVTLTGSLNASQLAKARVEEESKLNPFALDAFLTTQDWTYTGLSLDDVWPEDLVSNSGFSLNLVGNDTINLGRGNDVFDAGDGNDVVRGGVGNDDIFGGDGNDRLSGQRGLDLIYGGAGSDRIVGQADDDILHGEAGNDNIKGGGDEDELYGGGGNDFLKGGTGSDGVDGSDGNDTLSGNRGDDILFGGDGNDIIRGGSGTDVLFGDGGNDLMKGGSGLDLFIIDAQAGLNRIVDFSMEEDALLLLDTQPPDVIDEFTLLAFDEVNIDTSDVGAFVETYASITDRGVLFDFQNGSRVLLQGLDSTEGLSNVVFNASEFDGLV